jgi:hypothetical protein
VDHGEEEARRKRRAFTPEFKAEAVRLCRVGDRTIAQIAGSEPNRAWVTDVTAIGTDEG